MEWRDLGPIVGAIAPTAGKIIGGLIPFPGGALIGEQFGRIIARQMGVAETPDAVREAIEKSRGDAAVASITAAVERARVEVQGFVEVERAVQETLRASIAETQQTMRLELLPENRHWFFTGGRAAAMWVLVSYLAALAVLAVWASIHAFGGDDRPIRTLADAWPLHAAIIGPLGLLVGVFFRSPDSARPGPLTAPPAAGAPAPAKRR